MKNNRVVRFFISNKMAILGGIIATVLTGLSVFLIGNISGYQAKQLLSDSVSGLNVLCNTIILALVTILALLLTLLGISSTSGSNLSEQYYGQVLSLARVNTALLIFVLVLFQFFNMPILKSESIPLEWFEIIYWATLFFTSLICGIMITIVLMLYTTISNMITIIGLGKDHYLLNKIEKKEEGE